MKKENITRNIVLKCIVLKNEPEILPHFFCSFSSRQVMAFRGVFDRLSCTGLYKFSASFPFGKICFLEKSLALWFFIRYRGLCLFCQLVILFSSCKYFFRCFFLRNLFFIFIFLFLICSFSFSFIRLACSSSNMGCL